MTRTKTYVNKSAKEPGAMQTQYFNLKQTKEILSIAGPAGLILMQFYVAIGHQPNPNMEDNVLASMLDMSVKNVETLRLKLTKAGWFKRTKHTHQGITIITYDVGKKAVARSGDTRVAYIDEREE